MPQASARRPLPALAFLLGLTLLTALVWWRVIHRADSGTHQASSTPTCSSTAPSVLPQPSGVTVDVLNGTADAAKPRNGLAGAVSAALRKLGFQIATVGNDNSGTITGIAEIRYGPTGKAAAHLVSYYLPGAKLVATQRTDSHVEVSLGQKFQKLATAAQVKQAIAKAHVSQAPAHPRNLAVGPTGRTSATPSGAATSAATSTAGAHSTPTC